MIAGPLSQGGSLPDKVLVKGHFGTLVSALGPISSFLNHLFFCYESTIMLTGISFITSYWPLSSLSIFNLKVDLKHEIRYLFGILFNTHRRDLLEEGQNTTT